jgi:hypothetical protein
MKTLVHIGTMKRVRMSKEKSEYKQIITPNADSYFGMYLPNKLMVKDPKVKELQEVKVKFKILGTWKEHWPLAKVIEIIK